MSAPFTPYTTSAFTPFIFERPTRSKERRAAETNAPAVRAALVGASSVLDGVEEGQVVCNPVQVALARATALAIGRVPRSAHSRAPLGKDDVFQVPLYPGAPPGARRTAPRHFRV